MSFYQHIWTVKPKENKTDKVKSILFPWEEMHKGGLQFHLSFKHLLVFSLCDQICHLYPNPFKGRMMSRASIVK